MLRQARIGISFTGQLVYYQPVPLPNYPHLEPATFSSPKECRNDASILDAAERNSRVPFLLLPVELQLQIVHTVVDSPIEFSLGSEPYWHTFWEDYKEDEAKLQRGWFRYSAAYSLILTCKRFHALAIPLLYRTVSLDISPHWLNCPPQEKLFRTVILRRPFLQNYVEHLAVKGKPLCSNIAKIACELPRLRTLSMELARDEPGVSSVGPTKDQARTANFTKLQFHNLHARPQSVKEFLEWPRQLHQFVLNDMVCDGYSWAEVEPDAAYRWNHTLLADALSPQKDYLTVLDLGWLGYDRDQNAFPVSKFPYLQSMALCVAYERPNEQACRSWLTPSLKTLILDMHTNDSQGGPFSNFRQNQAQSIREFAKMAREWADGGRFGLV
ncbi:uncharacterized protein N7443_006532 [Penicillium atrosanguineum]|uniref:uncharacterized protein n=1 Tax=Penicillium atrosanguineum TaxID=1132637 RepID=UPI0023A39758|nr:uncharacterized protein N7443_006532 [Penicillium atrosanguineum]KAJ5298412.1 hypothetical protein N7443_006532 [Penicillium atrosanguineum]